jgi:lipopolysaccharide transport system ATP-binding protein
MEKAAISVENIGKMYRIGLAANKSTTFAEAMSAAVKAPLRRLRALGEHSRKGDDIFWALQDLSFRVNPGEVVGIIGPNGAGKSTLLKILSRITEPTRGRAVIRGRVGSLLEVGTGFHPELTGRENTYLNGAILGMKRAEINRKFDEIVDFSGVEQFLDTPVKRYSSGMYVRLAFAVAAHLEPEILIVDEVLAVGDAEFQKKCLRKMRDVAGGGRTVLFVSHNMQAIETLCGRALLIKNGRLAQDGPAIEVSQQYMRAPGERSSFQVGPQGERSGDGSIRLTHARILDVQGMPLEDITAGKDIIIEFDYENPGGRAELEIGFTIFNYLGRPITHCAMDLTGDRVRKLGQAGRVRCLLRKLPLVPGDYFIAVLLSSHGQQTDLLGNALSFSVSGSVFHGTHKTPDPAFCAAMFDHAWESVSPDACRVAGGV